MAEGEPKGDWTADELDLIIADYFAMLGAEVRRVSYDKTQHRQGRSWPKSICSNGSIEFKHQNISAVPQQLDLPWINGYKPRAHFQRLHRKRHTSDTCSGIRWPSTRKLLPEHLPNALSFSWNLRHRSSSRGAA
jgi:hypothetical protein